MKNGKQVVCGNVDCRKTFLTKRSWQKYCSIACRSIQWDVDHPRLTREQMDEYLASKAQQVTQ